MAHRKYADYECASCNRTITDLPIDSTRCPVCGKKRGFRRLFNAVQISTKGHRVARFVDRRLGPAYDAKSQRDATKFEKDGNVALDKAWELASSKQREDAVKANNGLRPDGKIGFNAVPAAAALGMIDPQARRDTREMVWPVIENRKPPVPKWER